MATEKKLVEQMIRVFCKGQRHEGGVPCAECRALIDYAWFRLDKCPFAPDKPACADCRIHCYKPEMRERIRAVMRYSGPRMVFHNPVLSLQYALKKW